MYSALPTLGLDREACDKNATETQTLPNIPQLIPMTISDSFVQFSSLHGKSSLVWAQPLLNRPLIESTLLQSWGIFHFKRFLNLNTLCLWESAFIAEKTNRTPVPAQACKEGGAPGPHPTALAEAPAVSQRGSQHTLSPSVALCSTQGFPDTDVKWPRLQIQSSPEGNWPQLLLSSLMLEMRNTRLQCHTSSQ